ncbi:MAG: succinate dehydrogenase assembly factor 2 [Pseudomonadota bacterium]
MSDEPRDHRLKRLHMRSMRRGIKEMDLILSAYASAHLAAMSDAQLDTYDALLNENDQDLIRWVTGQEPAPKELAALIGDISTTFQGKKPSDFDA